MPNIIVSSALVALALSLASPVRAQEATPSSDELAKILRSDAPPQEKANACRLLQRVATKDAVPALAGLLTDEKLSHMARYAMEPMADPSVDGALRDALGKVKGRLLAGVIGSLGVRRDAKAVDAVAGSLTNPDPEVAEAAARALGSIGTPAAAKALTAGLRQAPEASRLAFHEGLLRCAERLAATQNRAEAQTIYDSLRGMKEVPHQVRTAAIRGAIINGQEKGLVLLQEYLQNKDFGLFAAACRTSQELPGAEVTGVLTAALERLPAEHQVLAIQTIGFRADAAAVPALTEAAKEGAKSVRLAAVRALAEVRHDSAAAALRELAKDPDGTLSEAARAGLSSFEPLRRTEPQT